VIRLLGWLRSWTSAGAAAPTRTLITVYGSDTARMTVSGDELGVTIQGSDTPRLTVLGE